MARMRSSQPSGSYTRVPTSDDYDNYRPDLQAPASKSEGGVSYKDKLTWSQAGLACQLMPPGSADSGLAAATIKELLADTV